MDLNTEIIEIDPTLEQINEMVEIAKTVQFDIIEDQDQFEEVKEKRTGLQKLRLKITSSCKGLRESALAYQRKVIEYEKDLISKISPVEEHLKRIEDDYKEQLKQEERRKILPDRMSEVERNNLTANPEFIITLTSDEFNKWIVDARQKALDDQKAAQDQKEYDLKLQSRKLTMQEKELLSFFNESHIMGLDDEQFETFVQESIDKLAKIAQDAKDNADREAKAKEDKAAQDKADQEAKEIADKDKADKKLKKDKEYQDWLKMNNYDEKNCIIIDAPGKKIMYKEVAIFTLE